MRTVFVLIKNKESEIEISLGFQISHHCKELLIQFLCNHTDPPHPHHPPSPGNHYSVSHLYTFGLSKMSENEIILYLTTIHIYI
jgi:hypothetical protein